ncbi:MAG: glycosyltransferase family 4 protein [Pseudomonadota bacterium]
MQTDNFEIEPFPDLSDFRPEGPVTRRLRVCIVTEEIFGPVRNGGISSTYMYLAKMLAKAGHDVSVLYLKSRIVEDHSIEYWIDWYAQDGVTLVPMPDADFKCLGGFWQIRHHSVYRWLKAQPDFDVVHTSEWRGGCYYALLAKKQGLAFQNTVFIMKTSSPHVWNRHYQMQFLTDAEVGNVMYPEQMCVENGDIVVGGSAHLLRFMENVGYKLPDGRTFVQPNVIELAHLDIEDKRASVGPGDVVHCQELAFFGRLETRKGLEVFCEALDYLVARGTAPEKVSFLGKPGALLSEPTLNSLQYLDRRAVKWPFEIEIHTGFNQLEVISYLTETNRIAIMPSLIENSTMAVYEALIYNVPFIASNAGGTPELVAPEHHAEMLVPARPRELADGIARALRDGARVGRCSFDNSENLKVWNSFHEFLAARFEKVGAAEIIEEVNYSSDRGPAARLSPTSLSVCLLHRGPARGAQSAIDALVAEPSERPTQIVVASHEHGEATHEFAFLRDTLTAPEGVSLNVVAANERSLGEAYNLARGHATGTALVFARSDIHTLYKQACGILSRAFENSDASVFTCFFDKPEATGTILHHVPIGGDLAAGFYDRSNMGSSMIAIRADLFDQRGGFTDIFGVDGVEHNFVFGALLDGAKVEIIPERIVLEDRAHDSLSLNQTSARYLVARDLIQSSSYAMRRLLLNRDISQARSTPPGASLESQLMLWALPSKIRNMQVLEDAARLHKSWTDVLIKRPWAFEEWLAVRRLNQLAGIKDPYFAQDELVLNALPDGIDSLGDVMDIVQNGEKWSETWKKRPLSLPYVAAVRRLQKVYSRRIEQP